MAKGLRAVRLLVWAGFMWLRVWGACICKGCFEDAVGKVGNCSGEAIYGLKYWVKSGMDPVDCRIMA